MMSALLLQHLFLKQLLLLLLRPMQLLQHLLLLLLLLLHLQHKGDHRICATAATTTT